MTWLSLIAAMAAFALFALSTDAHALARLGRRPSPVARRARRAGAWAALAASFALAAIGRGLVFGPVIWTGVVMFAAGLVFLALNLLPTQQRTHR